MSLRRLLAILTITGLLIAAGVILLAAEAPTPLQYRRVFVPQEDIDRVVRGLLPMKRDEFERRIQEAQAASGVNGEAAKVRIASAEYRARLDGESLVDGHADLTIAHSVSGPAVLQLEPASFAIHGANWLGSSSRAARYGVDPAGRQVCLVEGAGTLSLSWSLAGRRNERGELEFRFHPLPTPRQQLRLSLPNDLTLTADRAIVARLDPDAGSQPSPAGYATWSVEVAGGGEVVLTISKPQADSPMDPLVLVKEQTAYTVQRGAIDVETSFDLDVLHKPLAQLVLACDRALELIAVRQGESSLTWSPLDSPNDQQLVAVSFTPPLQGKTDAIRVSATAKRSGRANSVLPRLQVARATWQEGRVTVAAEGSLPLRATAQTGCRASGFTPASPLKPNNLWQFQQFLPDARIQIALDDGSPLVEEIAATMLEFGPTQITGVYSAEISVTAGLCFELQAEVPRAWIVDSIEVQPADAMADRSLANRGNAPQLLRLALRRPIAQDRPVRLVIRAHRGRPPIDQWLPDDLFTIARPTGIRSARRLVAWQVTDPAALLSLSGDENLRRLDASQLSAMELRLFDVRPGAMLLELDPAADAPRARLQPTSPHYQADVLVRAEIDREEVREFWRLVCTPHDAAVGRLLVHCRPLPADPGQWRITGEDPREITVRPLEPTASSSDEGVFEITLVRPRQTPLEITAEFRRRRTNRQELPLVTLPSATSQTGHIELHALDGRPLALETQGLRGVAPPRSLESLTTLRGYFRYDPGRVARLSWHDPPTGRALPLAWIESLQLTSRFTADGTGQHEAVWTIHNAGHDRLEFRLPRGAQSVQARITDQQAVGLAAQNRAGDYSVPLPSGRNCVVKVTYATRDPPATWHWSSELANPMPRCELPILDCSWRVQLAPGLSLASSSSKRVRELDWAEALQSTDSAGESESGWISYEIENSLEFERGLRVYRIGTIVAWSWCLALATAAVMVRLAAGRWASLVLMAGVLAAAAIILPAGFAPLALGGLGGLVLGSAWLLLIPHNFPLRARETDPASRSTASLFRPTLGAGLLVAVAVGASPGHPPQPSPAGGPEPARSRVVIPADNERRPVGDYVFLDPAFYDALLKMTDTSNLATPDWLLSSAVYRPLISAKVGGERIQVDEIGATLDLETFRADALVEFSFRRSQIHLVERRARLDGEALIPEWSADGLRLRVLVRQPGKHRVELAWGAPSHVVGESERLEFAIAQAGDSRVELPASAARIKVASARGAMIVDESDLGRSIHLGNDGLLALHWPVGEDEPAGPARIEAEQLLLWTVRPGSVVANGKLRLRPLGGKIGEIAIEIDPRLRVLPSPANGVASRQWVDTAGPVSLLRVALAEPAATEVTVPIALLWAESSGIGNLALPKVMVRADKVTRAWSGVALSGNLQWESPPAARQGDPSSDEFAEAWSEPLDGPVFALDASLPATPTLLAQPAEPRISASQTVHCGVSTGSIGVRYVAALADLPADAFQHRLMVSPGVRVTSVQVLAGGAPVRTDWLQTADGEVLVTQHTAPTPEQELKLSGQVAVASSQRSVAAPLVKYAGAAEHSLELRVHRQHDVRVSAIADLSVWAEVAPVDAGQHREGLGRLAVVYRQLPGKSGQPPSLTMSPNRPEPVGHFLVRLVPGATEWSVEIDTALEMESDLLDALRMELPPALALPVTITPAVEHEIVKLPGQGGQLLTVRPQRAIDRSLRLTILGKLQAADTQIATLPAITLRGAPRMRHLVALPARLAGRRIEWETSGLQTIDSAALPGPLPAGYELFEAVVPRPTAVAQLQAATSQSPQVQLANHQVQVYRDGTATGHSRIDLVARGARQVELTTPPGCRLIHVAVEEVPAQLFDRGAGRWQLFLLDDSRPQRIDVVYSAKLSRHDAAGKLADFRPPRIEGAAIQESRWQIEPVRWTETKDGSVQIALPERVPRLDDRRLGLASVALGAGALLALLMTRDPVRGWLGRQAPLFVALGGGLWLIAGFLPWLGWIFIALAIWLAIRTPWPRAVNSSLSSVLGRSRLG